jgi:predicted DNA-binding antitoxin AbrB/MazE fold protein
MLKVYDYDGNPIINRKIRLKEKGKVLITKEMLIDILKAFSIASKKHNQDILKMLNFEEGALSNK